MTPSRAWLPGLGLVVAVAALVALRSPGEAVRPPQPLPLASPAVDAGRVGGLLPDATLNGRVRTSGTRDLRPAVVMLVGPACDCLTALRRVVAAAARLHLVTYVVEAGDSLDQPESLAAQAGGDVAPYADPSAALATAYRLHSPAALVLVRSDGVVTQVIDAVGPTLRLEHALSALV